MIRAAGFLILAAVLAGCGSRAELPTPSPIPTGLLTPFLSPTASLTPSLAPTLAQIPFTPQPTSTPFTHTIVKGDTMLGLAFKYGVKLEDLLAANPEIDPHFMIVGEPVIVPIEGGNPLVLPTPTAIPVEIETPDCYPTQDGGMWCLAIVRNDTLQPLESITAWIGLRSLQGEIIASQVVAAPLNVIYPGEAMPLPAFFEPEMLHGLQSGYQAQVELLTAFVLQPDDMRYLPLQVQVEEVDIPPTGDLAHIEGSLSLLGDSQGAQTIWLAGAAYGMDGRIVGVRKVEYQEGVQPGESKPFSFEVYSLGPVIARVEVLGEAR